MHGEIFLLTLQCVIECIFSNWICLFFRRKTGSQKEGNFSKLMQHLSEWGFFYMWTCFQDSGIKRKKTHTHLCVYACARVQCFFIRIKSTKSIFHGFYNCAKKMWLKSKLIESNREKEKRNRIVNTKSSEMRVNPSRLSWKHHQIPFI